MTTESWLPVPEFAEYLVSDRGRVRSVDRVVVQHANGRTRAFSRRLRGRVLKPAPNPKGYLHVNLKRGRQSFSHDVHILVLTAFVGPRPIDAQACHNNGDNTDNRLANLRWDTAGENALDRVRHGTDPHATRRTCPRRHELVIPNLVAASLRRGHRSCLACNRASAHIRNAVLRGKPSPGTLQEISDRYYAAITTSEKWAS